MQIWAEREGTDSTEKIKVSLAFIVNLSSNFVL
jgi:hypothetical protein